MNASHVRLIAVEQTYPLRRVVLRPHLPDGPIPFDGDDHPHAVHFGVFGDDVVPAGVVTLVPSSMPGSAEAWLQLRGMAVDVAFQGRGLGRLLLNAALAHATQAGVCVWCNARLSAVGFYVRGGFLVIGAEFEIEDAGPHVRMATRVSAEQHAGGGDGGHREQADERIDDETRGATGQA